MLFSPIFCCMNLGASHRETRDVGTASGRDARLGSDGISPAPAAGLQSSPVQPERRRLVHTTSHARLQHSRMQRSLSTSADFREKQHFLCGLKTLAVGSDLMWFVDRFFFFYSSYSTEKNPKKPLSTKLSCGVCMCAPESYGDIRWIFNCFV